MYTGFLRLLARLGLFLVRRLELVLVQHGMLETLAQLLVEIVEFVHLQMPDNAPALAAGHDRCQQNHQSSHNQRYRFSQKGRIFREKLHVFPLIIHSSAQCRLALVTTSIPTPSAGDQLPDASP
ncbi:hypothetical protein D9M68_922370 [compost metagenome]